MTKIYDREADEQAVAEEHSVRVNAKPGKLTAARLAKVEEIQGRMGQVAAMLADLTDEEENGWVAGNPQTGVTVRVEPLRKLTAEVMAGIEALETLYS